MRVSRYWATGLAIIGSVLCSTTALAVAGDVDAAYGSSGYFISTIGDSARGSVMQPDGKLLLAASCPQRAPATGKTFCISRLTTTGPLDSTFGTSGRAIVQAGDTNSIAEQAIKIACNPTARLWLAANARPVTPLAAVWSVCWATARWIAPSARAERCSCLDCVSLAR